MLENLSSVSSQTWIFTGIAVGAFLFVVGSFLLGGGDHDADHDHDGGGGHDHGDDASLSFFSPKIIFTFMLGFGAAGAIASNYGLKTHWCILIGIGFGICLALVAFAMLNLIYKQQSTSLINTNSALGKLAQVLTAIPADGTGEVGLEVQGQYQTYLARARPGDAIPKGTRVRVVENNGGQLLVEPVSVP
jgi:membrane protein implicated in regulation of membrane protease activity